ncbi:MAG: NADH-quinone oxidoreductase subunit NuoK [Deltaproteobacteria bacterium]|nr:NADH-quinone oxidoreductase subunit NuoK [Deltaproteobacteria bacterium]
MSYDHYLVLALALFFIGVTGVVLRRNALIILMSIELMLNAVNLAVLAAARNMGDMYGHGLALFIMTVAAAEAAVGLALVLAMFRHRRTVNVDEFRNLKG